MTDDQQNPASASEPIADAVFADAFDEWIGGANFAKRSVHVFSKPGLMAEYEDLKRRETYLLDVVRLAAEETADDESLADEPGNDTPESIELEQNRARQAEIAEEWDASKSVWVVRGLNDGDREHVEQALEAAGIKDPEAPKRPQDPGPLPAKRTPTQAKAHERAVAEYEKAKPAYDAAAKAYGEAMHAYSIELNTHILERAVVEIDFGNGRTVTAQFTPDGKFEAPAITVEQLKVLRDRLGQRNITNLIQAAQLAELEEPDIQAPFSSSSSQSDQT